MHSLYQRSTDRGADVSQPALVIIWPACVLSLVDLSYNTENYGDGGDHSGAASCFMAVYGFVALGCHGGVEIFRSHILGGSTSYASEQARVAIRARMMGRGLFMPFDPLVSLVGYVFLRSADSRDYAGESGDEVRDHVNRFQAAAYRSFKTIAVHDSVFRGEGFYPMAFLAPRFYQLPS